MSGDLTAAVAARIPYHVFEPLQRYLMTLRGTFAPRPHGLPWLQSEDLFHWKRLGLATFDPYCGIDFVHVDDKDASLFPVAVPITPGKCNWPCSIAPFFPILVPGNSLQGESRVVDLDHESIWISYCPIGFWKAVNKIASACLIRITAGDSGVALERLKSAAALRPS